MSKKSEKKNNTEKKEKKLTIHTTISKNANRILSKYVNLKDKNNKFLFGSKAKVIEKSLELLDKHYFPLNADIKSIWSRARDVLNMVLVG